MKTIFRILSILLFSIFLVSCNEDLIDQAQSGTLRGKVVKRGTNVPIENVKIFTAPTTETVFSKADGTFEIPNMPVGNYSVKAELSGYLTTFQAVNIQKRIRLSPSLLNSMMIIH